MNKYLHILHRFQQNEASSGPLLLLAATIAVILANSPWAAAFQQFWQTPLFIPHPPLLWINEGLMALFFFLVGLELKRELIQGELSQPSQVLLPLVAALGGMLIPALIYSIFNYQHSDTSAGWAIPAATDIAFALGVLSLFNKHIPLSLKLFLMALAIFDDIGAILIISFFYVRDFAWLPFMGAVAMTFLGYLLNRLKIYLFLPYLGVGIILWLCLLRAGIHPTMAGVILALVLPLGSKEKPLLTRIEYRLQPWVAYFIMPLFALANAGLSFQGPIHDVHRITLGIVCALLIGKPLGVFISSCLLILSGWAKLPENATWSELWGVSILCGIGFTMSLFLGTLAFSSNELYMIEVRLGVFLGSILSGIIGGAVLLQAIRAKSKAQNPRGIN